MFPAINPKEFDLAITQLAKDLQEKYKARASGHPSTRQVPDIDSYNIRPYFFPKEYPELGPDHTAHTNNLLQKNSEVICGALADVMHNFTFSFHFRYEEKYSLHGVPVITAKESTPRYYLQEPYPWFPASATTTDSAQSSKEAGFQLGLKRR